MDSGIRDTYEITGFFYENEGVKCRKYLDIKKKEATINTPDLMVIMMNPGGSEPLSGLDDERKPTPTKPDKTQDQIMRVMESKGFTYARILNLSDIRETKSAEFYKKLAPKKETPWHCIFSEQRSGELDKLFVKDTICIVAWGVNYKLRGLVCAAVTFLKKHKIKCFGNNKTDTNFHYHPLPRSKDAQDHWVKSICEKLSKNLHEELCS